MSLAGQPAFAVARVAIFTITPAVSVSMPTVRYEPERVGGIVAALSATAMAISREL